MKKLNFIEFIFLLLKNSFDNYTLFIPVIIFLLDFFIPQINLQLWLKCLIFIAFFIYEAWQMFHNLQKENFIDIDIFFLNNNEIEKEIQIDLIRFINNIQELIDIEREKQETKLTRISQISLSSTTVDMSNRKKFEKYMKDYKLFQEAYIVMLNQVKNSIKLTPIFRNNSLNSAKNIQIEFVFPINIQFRDDRYFESLERDFQIIQAPKEPNYKNPILGGITDSIFYPSLSVPSSIYEQPNFNSLISNIELQSQYGKPEYKKNRDGTMSIIYSCDELFPKRLEDNYDPFYLDLLNIKKSITLKIKVKVFGTDLFPMEKELKIDLKISEQKYSTSAEIMTNS